MTCSIRPDVVLVIAQPQQASPAAVRSPQQGCVFTHAFTPSASPDDALWSLLTGCHAHRRLGPPDPIDQGPNGQSPNNQSPVVAESIVHHLAAAGYWTVWLGAWLSTESSTRLGFDHVASPQQFAGGQDSELLLTQLRCVAQGHGGLFLTVAIGDSVGLRLADVRRVFADALIVSTATTGREVSEADDPEYPAQEYPTQDNPEQSCPDLDDRTLRVPLSFDWQGQLDDKTRGELVTTLDIAPTLYDLCGLSVSRHHDGRSLRPLLYRRQSCLSGWRTYVVSEFHATGRLRAPARTLRNERWRYTRLLRHGEAMFDLDRDPRQEVNLADVVAHRAMRDELSDELDAWQTRHDDPLNLMMVTDSAGKILPGEEFFAEPRSDRLMTRNDRERLYRAICEEIDSERLDRLWQRVSGLHSEHVASYAKYAKYDYWLRRYINWYLADNLYRQDRPLRILDVGCGAGYFAAVCRHFGHEVVAVDLPDDRLAPLEADVFGETLAALGIKKTPCIVAAFQTLDVPGKFDLITCHLVCFNNHGRGGEWSRREWEFFIRDINTHLRPDGRLLLELNDNPTRFGPLRWYDEPTREFFASVGTVCGRIVCISQQSNMAPPAVEPRTATAVPRPHIFGGGDLSEARHLTIAAVAPESLGPAGAVL